MLFHTIPKHTDYSIDVTIYKSSKYSMIIFYHNRVSDMKN